MSDINWRERAFRAELQLGLLRVVGEKLRDREKRIRLALKLIEPMVDYEIGEGTRGEVRDPLRDVVDALSLRPLPKGKRR